MPKAQRTEALSFLKFYGSRLVRRWQFQLGRYRRVRTLACNAILWYEEE